MHGFHSVGGLFEQVIERCGIPPVMCGQSQSLSVVIPNIAKLLCGLISALPTLQPAPVLAIINYTSLYDLLSG